MNRSQHITQIAGLIILGFITLVGLHPQPERANAQTVPGPTPLPGQLQLPTATPTMPGGPTLTPTRTPTLTPVMAQAISTPVNLRDGPGMNTNIVGVLSSGDTVPIIGRLLQIPWYMVLWADGPGGKAWVYKDVVIVLGDETTVPIVDIPALPTIDPARAAIDQTATVVLQTPGAAETATAAILFQPTGIYTVTPGSESLTGGSLPTFTLPPPITQPAELPPSPGQPSGGGIPPAPIIIGLGVMGLVSLGLGMLRRVV